MENMKIEKYWFSSFNELFYKEVDFTSYIPLEKWRKVKNPLNENMY